MHFVRYMLAWQALRIKNLFFPQLHSQIKFFHNSRLAVNITLTK